jgi:inner membrane protein
MASIGHVAIALAARRLHERDLAARPAVITSVAVWSALSLLPDADVIAFALAIPYEAPWGHRGATHSLAFAGAVGLLGLLAAKVARLPALRTALLAAATVASHGVADAFTDGGLGSALLWPASDERFFAPWTPIPVAPIGLSFLSSRGLYCAMMELLLFAPFFVYGLWPRRQRTELSGPRAERSASR